MAIFYLYDPTGNTRTDYSLYDIVDIADDTRIGDDGQPVMRFPALPPAVGQPFLVRVAGVTKAESVFLTETELNNDNSVKTKRLWTLRTQNVPVAIRNYMAAHRFCGFGGAADVANYGSIVSGDTVIQWADARTWMYNKTTKTTA